MKYIKLNQGVYANTLPNINTAWDDNNFCTPEALVRDGKNEAFDVTIMVETVAPAFNPLTQTLAEVDPIKDAEGLWTQTWEVSDLSTEDAAAMLATAQATAWENIKTERDRRKSLGVKVGDHWYHSDADSRIQQISLFVMGASVPPVQWKTLTLSPLPVFVTMTQAIAGGIFQNTAASDTAVFAAAEVHRIAMEASDDPENYDFSGGWPVSIEDAV